MIYFAGWELVATGILVSILYEFEDKVHYREQIRPYVISGVYVLFQSIGVLWLKMSIDPLEGISKLGYLHLISRNQRINLGFIESVHESLEWKNLSKE